VQARSPLAAPIIRWLRCVSSSRSPPSSLRFGRLLPAARSEELPTFGPFVPTNESRSARVVSHHLDGLLRPRGAGVVAACCRSWGSSRFGLCPPRDAYTPRRISPPTAAPALTAQPRGVETSRSGHAPMPFTRARALALDRLRGFVPSTGLSLPVHRCRQPVCSVLPWASVPPSILGTV
jgi:hypothetical protein